ncbi:hypothetical protein DFP72DRAFT_1065971 [Ephemerocybe angulata]|uniref:RNase H type-1 domain-containing protein n=1 Tax=Ephemerocybe angulata TaxID=980116 RepID=A0A8H6I1D3_9AGAR|nr:hypothetical protein DFP72DRAFT_1065971 [Tulosesus angulatus]
MPQTNAARSIGPLILGHVRLQQKHRTEENETWGHTEVYDGKLATATIVLNMANAVIRENPNIEHIHYFINNSAAVATITDPHPRSGQKFAHCFYRNTCLFLDDNPMHQVTVHWCPSYCKIPGNKAVDKLAKEVTALTNTAPYQTLRANVIWRAKANTE